MLPVISGIKTTKLNIFVYALLLFPIVLAPFFLKYFGLVYLLISGILSIYYVFICFRLLKANESRLEKKIAKQIFGFSIFYLFMIFTSILIDRII